MLSYNYSIFIFQRFSFFLAQNSTKLWIFYEVLAWTFSQITSRKQNIMSSLYSLSCRFTYFRIDYLPKKSLIEIVRKDRKDNRRFCQKLQYSHFAKISEKDFWTFLFTKINLGKTFVKQGSLGLWKSGSNLFFFCCSLSVCKSYKWSSFLT